MRIAIIGAGAIGSTFALKLAQAGQDVTLVVRNDARRARLAADGLQARPRLGRRRERVEVGLTTALDDDYDLVIVPVQRQQIDALVPTLAANGSRRIMLMFNCASGADQWTEQLGADRLLWGFPAMLADRPDGETLEYVVIPGWLRPAQITTIGRPDGAVTDDLREVQALLRKAGVPTVIEADIDGWLKSHAAYFAPLMAMGYSPARARIGPRFNGSDARLLAGAMSEGLAAVRASGARVTPANVRILARIPTTLVALGVWLIFWSPMARRSLASHSGAAPREVEMLLAELRDLAERAGRPTPYLERLAALVPPG